MEGGREMKSVRGVGAQSFTSWGGHEILSNGTSSGFCRSDANESVHVLHMCEREALYC